MFPGEKEQAFCFLFYGILLASILIKKYSYINILCQDIYSPGLSPFFLLLGV